MATLSILTYKLPEIQKTKNTSSFVFIRQPRYLTLSASRPSSSVSDSMNKTDIPKMYWS